MVRYLLRLPDELHERLVSESQALGRSLHAHILWALEKRPPASAFLTEAGERLRRELKGRSKVAKAKKR